VGHSGPTGDFRSNTGLALFGKIPEVAAASGQETCQLNSLSRKLVAYLYPDERGRMPQYLNVTRLRTYGGEGLLTKLLRIENQLLERTSAQLSFWEKRKNQPTRLPGFRQKWLILSGSLYGWNFQI